MSWRLGNGGLPPPPVGGGGSYQVDLVVLVEQREALLGLKLLLLLSLHTLVL